MHFNTSAAGDFSAATKLAKDVIFFFFIVTGDTLERATPTA